MICTSCQKTVDRVIVLSPTTKLCVPCALERGDITKEELKLLPSKSEATTNSWIPYAPKGGWDAT